MEILEIETKELQETILGITSSVDIQNSFLHQGEEQERVYNEVIRPLIYPDSPTFQNTKMLLKTLIGIVGESDNQDGIDQNTRDCAIAIISTVIKKFPHKVRVESKKSNNGVGEKTISTRPLISTIYEEYLHTLEKQHKKDHVDPYGEIASLIMLAPIIVDLSLTPEQLTKLEVRLFHLRYIPYRLNLDPHRMAGGYIVQEVSKLGIASRARIKKDIMSRTGNIPGIKKT